MVLKNRVAMFLAEFLGAATLTAAVYTIAARTSFPLFTGIAAAATVALFTVAVGSASGAHLNPAITFGMWSVRKVSTVRAVVMIVAQMLGGLAAWSLLKYFLGRELTSVAGDTFEWKVFTAEAIGAGLFAFGFTSAVMQKFEGGKLAATIGGSLLVGVLVASLAANAVLNPAVAVGIQSWSWAYATAPFAGALVGTNLFARVFADEKIAVTLFSSKTKRSVVTTKVAAPTKKVKKTVKKTTKKKR